MLEVVAVVLMVVQVELLEPAEVELVDLVLVAVVQEQLILEVELVVVDLVMVMVQPVALELLLLDINFSS